MKRYLVRFTEPYKDGTWFPCELKRGEEVEVDEPMLSRLQRSGFTGFTVKLIIPRNNKVKDGE